MRPSSMLCTQCSLSRHGAPGPADQADGWQSRRGRPACPRRRPRPEEDTVNTGEHPVFLATPPGAHQAQLLAVLFEHRVIAHPGPLPAAPRGLTLLAAWRHSGTSTSRPKRRSRLSQERLGSAPSRREGGSYPSPARGTVQCWCGSRTKRGKHHTDDLAQELLLTAQAPFDLGHEVFRKPQVIEGLVEGLRRRVAPGGDHGRGGPELAGGDAVYFWPVFWRLVCVGTWWAPLFRERGLCRVKSTQVYVTHPLRVWADGITAA